MRNAIVFGTDGNDAWRIKICIGSMRILRIQLPEIVLLTVGGKIEDSFFDGIRQIDVTGILAGVGISKEGWSRSWSFADIVPLAIPLVPELAQFDQVLRVESDVIVRTHDFAQWFNYPCRDYELVAASGDPWGDLKVPTDSDEARRSLSSDAYGEMTARIWLNNPIETHVHFNPGICIWNNRRIRRDIQWYVKRVTWFWDAVLRGFVSYIGEDFVNIFLDSSALLSGHMHVKDRMQPPVNKNEAAHHYNSAAYDQVSSPFAGAASALGLCPGRRIESRIDIINAFIERRGYSSYLEIGVSTGDCFRAVVAQNKRGVDPDPSSAATDIMTSDSFFSKNTDLIGTIDIVFIDGLHLCEQVEKDIQNALMFLRKNGVIVLHDCLPYEEIHAARDRQTAVWNGDVWKAVSSYFADSPYLCYTVNTDFGCGVIDTSKKRVEETNKNGKRMEELTWGDYVKDKNRILSIVKPADVIPLLALD